MALMIIGFVVETMIVDPYDYWGLPRIEGVNIYKPKVHTQLKIAKTGQYLREKPRTVVAGNSRVDVGFDPESTVWPSAMEPVYNFGLPGESMASVAETLTTVMAEHRPRRIYLGVDFLDFLVTSGLWSGFEDGTLAPRRPTLQEQMQGLARTTFSLTALMDSALTVLEQTRPFPADTRRDGFTPLEDYYAHVEREGHAALFEQRTRETVQRLLTQPRHMEWPMPGNNPSWVRLEQFLAHARAQGVEVVLFTYPYHAELMESLRQTGKWGELRQWHERLAAVAAKEGATLWSFLGYNSYTTEAVPKAGDRSTHMQWYWEAGHFKPALGELMMARMLDSYDAPTDFGRKLTPGTVGAALAALEAEGELYRARPNASSHRVAAYVRAKARDHLAQVDVSPPTPPVVAEMSAKKM
ncbi:hypothetical protein [Pedomonas mirosovicensis]|uniref:hypothetical protein n=1 Tax=Pedomonas mirosovicensis TaxID=2908641 RepID=UPI002169115E|nr:hypothetical protein [Pedomonas mirosovicensis]MCH8685531.1 hypothetical protein [Pedomonas mirosovicensis]